MDNKTLQKEFVKAWDGIKTLLDQQADELKTQSDIIAELVEAKEEQEEVLKELINRQY
jgi:hypothetical protein